MRYQWFGEGEYERSERSIRQLLAETGAEGIGGDLVWVGAHGVEADADWNALRSPETYLGLQRAERFRARRAGQGKGSVFTAPGRLPRNDWALSGAWTLQTESVVSHESGGRIAFRFHARDVHLVMGPVEKGGSVAFRVWLDGEPPGGAHGIDVDADGASVARDQRMYQLIRQPSPIVDRTLEVQFLDPGVEAFVFTFG
jgi:hypothetical protein